MIVDAHTHFWFKGFMPMAFHRNTAEEWAKKEAGASRRWSCRRSRQG